MRFSHLLIVPVLGLVLSACSSTPDTVSMDQRDPYEETNRNIFAFNMKLDDVVLEPVAKAYRTLPGSVQTAIGNHAEWTSHPSTAVNSALQGKGENAALATINFLMNSLTLGFFDLTEDDDPEREDFGQTLAHWSAPEGPYIVAPLFGPGTTRHQVGRIVDSITNPFSLMGEPTADVIATTQSPVELVSFRGQNFDQINEIKYNAADPYARTRSIYYQYRRGQINDSRPDAESDADASFDAFLNEDGDQ